MNLFGSTVSLSPAALDQGALAPSVSDTATRGPVSGSAGTADQIAFLPAVPPAAAAAVLVVGIAAHVQRLLHAPPNPTAYAQIEADCRKQFTEQLQRLPGLSAQGMRSAHRVLDGLLANLHKIKFSGVGDVVGAFKAALRDFPAQLSRVLSSGPTAQPQAGPRSQTPPAAAPTSRPVATRAHQAPAAAQLSAAQMAQLKGVLSQAGALKAQAQAGQPLTAAQLAQGGPARELAQLHKGITALLRAASPALATHRHELQRTQEVAAGHAAGLYRITAHKAIAGAPYSKQSLKALDEQARTVMRAPGDDHLLEKLTERLQRGKPTPPARLPSPGERQTVTHTNTDRGTVKGAPEEKLNRQALEKQAEQLKQAARQAYEALKTGLPGRDWEQYLQDLADRHGVSVASLNRAIAQLVASDQPQRGGTQSSTVDPSSPRLSVRTISIANVNPNFRPQSEVGINKFNTNCEQCMLKVDELLGGSGRRQPRQGIASTPDELQAMLEQLPEGTRVQIVQGFLSTKPGSRSPDLSPRHFFNAQVSLDAAGNKVVVFYDGQQNLVETNLPGLLRRSHYGDRGASFAVEY